MSTSVLTFGQFRLIPPQRTLLKGDRPVRLGSRAFDILVALAQRAGDVVSKNELLASAWPSTCIEEVTLRVHITTLRRILGEDKTGDRYIMSVSGRGYCFVAPVIRVEASPMLRRSEAAQPFAPGL